MLDRIENKKNKEEVCISLLLHFTEKNDRNKRIAKILLSNMNRNEMIQRLSSLNRSVSTWAVEFYPDLIIPILKNSNNKGVEYLLLEKISEFEDQEIIKTIALILEKEEYIKWSAIVARNLPEEILLELAKRQPDITSSIFLHRREMLYKLGITSPACAQNLLTSKSANLTDEEKEGVRSSYLTCI